MKRCFTFFLFALGLSLLLVISVGAAEEREAIFYQGTTPISRAAPDANGILTLPAGPQMGNQQFVGWSVLQGDTQALYAPGDSFSFGTETEDISFYAVGVEIKTLNGAAVTFSAPNTLRFDGAVRLADYQKLLALVGEGNISLGILIADYGDVKLSTPLTLDGGIPSLVNRTPATFAYTTEAWGVFVGSSHEIPASHLLEKYSGRAYISIRINGKAHALYGSYDPTYHARSVHSVSAAAYSERALVQTETHCYQVFAGSFSRYDTVQLSALRARLDQVIYLSTEGGGSIQSKYSMNNYSFITFYADHYISPYRVERVLSNTPAGYDTFVITGTDGANFRNITAYFSGGSYGGVSNSMEYREDGLYIRISNSTGR